MNKLNTNLIVKDLVSQIYFEYYPIFVMKTFPTNTRLPDFVLPSHKVTSCYSSFTKTGSARNYKNKWSLCFLNNMCRRHEQII